MLVQAHPETKIFTLHIIVEDNQHRVLVALSGILYDMVEGVCQHHTCILNRVMTKFLAELKKVVCNGGIE